jgi:hypothetical protein
VGVSDRSSLGFPGKEVTPIRHIEARQVQLAMAPLADPAPSSFQPRYTSGFGSDDSLSPTRPASPVPRGYVYYGFHDVIELNGTYYAFAESNQSQTMLVRSADGDDVWEAFASVGDRLGDGPLELPSGVSVGWTTSGSFVDL